jgi:UDP-N-acetylglucosamine 2-epimerase (non-hydrolysing)
MHILHVVGAPPSFMKVAPVMSALGRRSVRQTLVHTGQHHDVNMSDAIFRELRIPNPDENLGVGAGTHAEQTAHMLTGMERCLLQRQPDLVLVYGDSNSALAASLAASKAGVPIGHIEAGLRSGERATPEEINSLVTDRLATWHFTPSEDADENLLTEGAEPSSIKRVGNVMIDTLVQLIPLIRPRPLLEMLGLMNAAGPRPYVLVTLHTPANVDDDQALARILETLTDIVTDIPVVFPVPPRTRARMKDHQLQFSGLLLTEPLSYLQFLGLQRHATVVITDSGSIQEETTYLGVPCLTVRDNTDRPVTEYLGTNTVVGSDLDSLRTHVMNVLNGRGKRGSVPPLWDGLAAGRIADCLVGEQ